MNPCQTCGKDIYPSNGDTICRLCRQGIAGFAPGRVIYKQPKREKAIHDLERCNAMSALWDDAASALSRRDYGEFDRIMLEFRALRSRPDKGEPMRRVM